MKTKTSRHDKPEVPPEQMAADIFEYRQAVFDLQGELINKIVHCAWYDARGSRVHVQASDQAGEVDMRNWKGVWRSFALDDFLEQFCFNLETLKADHDLRIRSMTDEIETRQKILQQWDWETIHKRFLEQQTAYKK